MNADANARFGEIIEELRPELHRFCARMTGSVADGEDVLQEVLVKAYSALPELREPSRVRQWLYRMAHNQAIDYLRSDKHRMRAALAQRAEAESEPGADEQLAHEEAVRAAIPLFLALPTLQRSCVILKDVLDHSLLEIAELLEVSVPAVQAALHRGRTRLRELGEAVPEERPLNISPTVARYAGLFNARDWEGVRAMLADELRLEVVARFQRTGRDAGTSYFTNYDLLPGWRVTPAWVDGREVLAFFPDPGAQRPSYFIELQVAGDKIASIRDFRHVPYVAQEARIDLPHHRGPADRLQH